MPGDYEYSETTKAAVQELRSFLAEKDAQPAESDDTVVDAVDTQADTQEDHTADQPDEDAGSDNDQRYKSLQGKYNAETRELRESNAKLQQQMSELLMHLTAIKQPVSQQEEPPVDDGTKDLEELGDSSTYIHAYVSKQLQVAKQQMLKQIEDKLSGLTAKLDDTAMSVIESRVAPKIEGYNELISSQEFTKFLGKRDPLSGVTYQTLLADATKSGDEERVVAIINAARPKDKAPVKAKPSVAPPRGTAAPAKPTTETPVVYDQKFMDNLQRRIQRKEFSSPEGRKELARINREILNSIK